ncbi:MAG TPA: SET domain-containing protein-lysine N-methyltransferase [Gemmataceae bacterium]|nr:SET domain-containing protein-lysine N-methyltransferase [Gemmataceae bacterium]
MLIVRTYLAPSKINGLGVFAREFISAGSVVWEFTPELDLEYRIDVQPRRVQEYLRHYGSEVEPGVFLLCGDNARFMNHCENPNISGAENPNIALREIAAGEEITCNYAEFDLAFKGSF